jgi:hypothetical protein
MDSRHFLELEEDAGPCLQRIWKRVVIMYLLLEQGTHSITSQVGMWVSVNYLVIAH